MIESIFPAIGLLLATGPGVLLLATLAASIVLIWDWRWALAAAVIALLALSSIQATLHHPGFLVTSSQWIGIITTALLLGLAGRLHPAAVTMHTNSNWLTRLVAVLFVLGAWWVLDPGVSLPLFTQVETDLILWIGLCGLLLVSLTATPLHTGIGLLLLLAPLQATAAILLPGSGLAVIASIAQILVGLACAYLTLVQPTPRRVVRQALPLPSAPAPTSTRPRLPAFRRQALPTSRIAAESGRESQAPVEKIV